MVEESCGDSELNGVELAAEALLVVDDGEQKRAIESEVGKSLVSLLIAGRALVVA